MESQERVAGGSRVLEEVRNVMRLHHYSIHTERTYIDWIKRYIHFHHMKRREDLENPERKIELFLTDLAVNGRVAPSTQNQAMNALVSSTATPSSGSLAISMPSAPSAQPPSANLRPQPK